MQIKSRRKAREAALQAVYGCDMLNDWNESVVLCYFDLYHPNVKADPESVENYNLALDLIHGVREKIIFIDELLSSVSEHWPLQRMCKIDRNILRIAIYEIAFYPSIPLNASINEAIELAKEYGGDESPTFVNGVIDRAAKKLINDHQFAEFIASKAERKLPVAV